MIPFSPEIIREYRELGAWGGHRLTDLFERNVDAKPTSMALVDAPNKADFSIGAPRRFTYDELRNEVNRLAVVLLSEGFVKDDIILVQVPNIAELVILYLAASRIGLIISPIPVQYREKEIKDILSTMGANAYFTTTRFKNFSHADYFAEKIDFRGLRIYTWGENPPKSAISLDWLVLQISDDHLLGEYLNSFSLSADDIFTICWTSGTTGQPKGVPRTHNNWITTGVSNIESVGLREGDCLMVPFPAVNMSSVGGIFLPWLMTAGKLVLHHPFDMKVFFYQIKQEAVNYTVAAPALLNMILKDPVILKYMEIGSLRNLTTGSAPPDAWMMKAFQYDYGIAITNFYGSNEGTPLCSAYADIPDPEKRAKYFPRAGVPRYKWRNRADNWITTKLVDEKGALIDTPGKPGELLARGPSLFPGYYRKGGILDRSAFDSDGFFYTGDLFEIATEDGDPRFYRFVGRKKDLIIRGGMNISPVELDELLSHHPKLLEAAVAGCPDEIMGERVCAFVVPKRGQLISLEEIREFLGAEGVAQYKIPEHMVVLDALPRNPLNKILRQELSATFFDQEFTA